MNLFEMIDEFPKLEIPWKAIIIILWVIVGVIGYGFVMGNMMHGVTHDDRSADWECNQARVISSLVLATGPFGFGMSFAGSSFGEYGWQLHCYPNDHPHPGDAP